MKGMGVFVRSFALCSFAGWTSPEIPPARSNAPVVGLAMGAVLVLYAAAAVASSTLGTSRMVLRASDLPPGFVVVGDETGPYTNSDLIREYGKALAPALRGWGRINGYRAFYRQRDPTKGALPGVVGFGASVGLYRTARGAHAALNDRRAGCRNKAFTIIGLGGFRPVGQDTLVCTRGKRISGVRVRIFLVQWRNARATGGVYVVTIEGAVTPLAALTGARKQNRRMTAELRRS